jgi:hypothetical protein
MTETMAFDTGLRLILESLLGGLCKAFPAMVVSYDPLAMRAELQPCLTQTFKGIPKPLPILSEVPVMFMSSGLFHVLFAPNSGSYGLCIVSDKSMDEWLLQGAVATPLDNRQHDLSDAIFIPGLFPIASAAAIVPPVATGDLEIRDSAGLVSIALTAAGVNITAPIVTIDGVNVTTAVPGVPGVTVGAVSHVHSVVCPSGGGTVTTAPPTPGT